MPGAREMIEAAPCVIEDEERQKELRGRWNELFGNDHPIHIEVGMGKGRFIMTLARMHPEINFVGIEKYSSVMIRAVQKWEETQEKNIFFLRMDAEDICEVFDRDEISRIYLNFSDPWPKDRHAKRRLTSRQFLARYDQILVPDGRVIFKTDNSSLFDFSLAEAEQEGWILDYQTRDLHHSPYAEGNVMTEYEERFSRLGQHILSLSIWRSPASLQAARDKAEQEKEDQI